jgi:membrane-associated phospholipid phosphatase
MASRLIKEFIEECSAFGSFPFFLFLIGLFFLIGQVKLGIWLIIGLILSFAIIIVIKLFYFKERPLKKEHKNLFEKIEASSFPSLHSWRIVMILVFLSYYYKSVYLTIFLGIVTVIVLFSRKYLKKHFWIDIVFGALFGLIMSWLIIWLV